MQEQTQQRLQKLSHVLLLLQKETNITALRNGLSVSLYGPGRTRIDAIFK